MLQWPRNHPSLLKERVLDPSVTIWGIVLVTKHRPTPSLACKLLASTGVRLCSLPTKQALHPAMWTLEAMAVVTAHSLTLRRQMRVELEAALASDDSNFLTPTIRLMVPNRLSSNFTVTHHWLAVRLTHSQVGRNEIGPQIPAGHAEIPRGFHISILRNPSGSGHVLLHPMSIFFRRCIISIG